MATVVQAIDKIAQATGLAEARVSWVARQLREAGADLWPRSGRGGGKQVAHVKRHHLINLTLALLASEAPSDAPEIVRHLRDLVAQRRLQQGPGHQAPAPTNDLGTQEEGAPARTLGDALEDLVSLYTSGIRETVILALEVSRGLAPSRTFHARLRYARAGAFWTVDYGQVSEPVPAGDDPFNPRDAFAPFTLFARATPEIFEILAGLLQDTEQVVREKTPPDGIVKLAVGRVA